MDSSRFTVTLSSLDSIQKALRTSARNAGDAEDKVVSLSTCDDTRGWEDNAEIARENIEKARKMLASVSPDLSNLTAQVGERKVLLQRLIQNPFVTGAFGSSDPLFVGLLSHSIYDEPFFNPNRPPPPPKKKKGGGFLGVLSDLSGWSNLRKVDDSDQSILERAGNLVLGIPIVGPGKFKTAGQGLYQGGKWAVRGIRGGKDAAKARRATRVSRAGENLPEYVVRTKSMPKPHIDDPKLGKYVDDLYREGATIGTGSTADAVRHTRITGQLVGKSGKGDHVQKAENAIKNLQRRLRDHSLSDHDRSAVNRMILDLEDALATKPGNFHVPGPPLPPRRAR